MQDGQPHVLVVDDDARLRDLLRRFLAEQQFRVTTAADAGEARTHLRSLAFDLIVLDVMMPGEDGLSLTADLRRDSDVPILLLTARGEPEDRIAGLASGADDYLGKPFEPRELVLRMRAILRRSGGGAQAPVDTAPPPTLRLGSCLFDRARGTLAGPAGQIRLTGAEARLLAALAETPGRPVSREALRDAGRLAGNERAVDVQVTRLRRKIEPDPKLPRYLQTVRGEGYVLWPD
ncbi:MAG: response regulator [Alphaproteobacteria bacterium]